MNNLLITLFISVAFIIIFGTLFGLEMKKSLDNLTDDKKRDIEGARLIYGLLLSGSIIIGLTISFLLYKHSRYDETDSPLLRTPLLNEEEKQENTPFSTETRQVLQSFEQRGKGLINTFPKLE